MTHFIKISLVLTSGLFAGCQTMDTPTPEFGSAIRNNITVQTVEPTPEQKQNTYIRPDSQRMAAARERYKKDEVETPKDLTTTGD